MEGFVVVQIVTDSSVLYTEEETKAAGFDVIPLCVSVGDMDGRDLQIDMEAVSYTHLEGICDRRPGEVQG